MLIGLSCGRPAASTGFSVAGRSVFRGVSCFGDGRGLSLRLARDGGGEGCRGDGVRASGFVAGFSGRSDFPRSGESSFLAGCRTGGSEAPRGSRWSFERGAFASLSVSFLVARLGDGRRPASEVGGPPGRRPCSSEAPGKRPAAEELADSGPFGSPAPSEDGAGGASAPPDSRTAGRASSPRPVCRVAIGLGDSPFGRVESGSRGFTVPEGPSSRAGVPGLTALGVGSWPAPGSGTLEAPGCAG
jgi:hypothetical protein